MSEKVPFGRYFMSGLWVFPAFIILFSSVSIASWDTSIVDKPKVFGEITDRAVVRDSSGILHMAYVGNALFHARFDGERWSYEIVDSGIESGGHASIASGMNRSLHIVYYDGIGSDLKYALFDGDVWDISVVDSEYRVGGYTSIRCDQEGNPHISYHDFTNGALKYAVKNSAGWIVTVVDAQGTAGAYSSLVLDPDDTPHISYFMDADHILKHATYTENFWAVSTVDTMFNAGRGSSIALSKNNEPAISYTAGNPVSMVRFAYMSPLGWRIDDVYEESDLSYETSLIFDQDDNPAISFHGAACDLKIARRNKGSWSVTDIDDRPG